MWEICLVRRGGLARFRGHMSSKEEFYGSLHTRQADYSGGTYNFPALYRAAAFRQWAARRPNAKVRMLDVGCGKGRFFIETTKALREGWNITPEKLMGFDLIKSPGAFFDQLGPAFEFQQGNVDGQKLPFADASFDFVSCNHVLEHIFETEQLVSEFRRVIKPDGFCVISVPNTAAWINRLLFLFAVQPLGSEVGTRTITYGFWPTGMQEKLKKFNPSGHIRDFTPRGLRDLVESCGFQTVGWWAQSEGFPANISSWAGRNIGILLQPK